MTDAADGRDAVVAGGAGTRKREVHGITSSGRRLVAGPPQWFRSWPLRFENVTLHVDREQFDQRLFQAAVDAGAGLVAEKGLLVNRVVIPRPHPNLLNEMV